MESMEGLELIKAHNKLKDKKILITGATGFVGANLLRKLIDSKNDIHIIIRSTSNIWRIKDIIYKASIHYCDLNNREKIKKIFSSIKPEIIFNFSAYGGYPFQKDSSNNYLNIGLSEAEIIGMAAGLALAGKQVFVYSIIPFVALRGLEQIRNDLYFQRLPVKIIGVGEKIKIERKN